MALIEALICYILYVVVVLLYYQYYIGKCKCFTRAQLGKARAVIAALRGRVAHARARLCNETRNPAFVLPGRQHAAPLALLPRRLAAVALRRCDGGEREPHEAAPERQVGAVQPRSVPQVLLTLRRCDGGEQKSKGSLRTAALRPITWPVTSCMI